MLLLLPGNLLQLMTLSPWNREIQPIVLLLADHWLVSTFEAR
jgi:hypothetical protein